MSKCFICKEHMPEPDLKEAVNRELDWRDEFPEDEVEERVLICIKCSNEIEEEDE